MKNLILIPIILIMTNSISAEKNRSEKNKSTHLEYEKCIQLYGMDDTSIAIINIYFDKRYTASVGQLSFLPVTAVLTFFNPPIGIVLMAVSSPVYINGAIKFNKYGQKNMIKTLNNYHNNNMLAKNIRNKVVNYLMDEKIDNNNLVKENIALSFSTN